MRRFFIAFFVVLISNLLSAQNPFEGIFSIEYKNEKKEVSKLEVKIKDKLVHLKSIQGGVAKYDFCVLNLATREFYTMSTKGKKIIIKYDIDKLMELYEREQLKEGYKRVSDIVFKPTDKTKEENGNSLTKYVGENDIYRSLFWIVDTGFNFNQLIPVLRLIGYWNEAQASQGIMFSAEVIGKVSKRESTILVTMKREPVPKEIFELPKDYLQKDFSKLMEENKSNKDLKTIIQTFAEF